MSRHVLLQQLSPMLLLREIPMDQNSVAEMLRRGVELLSNSMKNWWTWVSSADRDSKIPRDSFTVRLQFGQTILQITLQI
jgi:hypothetical protein